MHTPWLASRSIFTLDLIGGNQLASVDKDISLNWKGSGGTSSFDLVPLGRVVYTDLNGSRRTPMTIRVGRVAETGDVVLFQLHVPDEVAIGADIRILARF